METKLAPFHPKADQFPLLHCHCSMILSAETSFAYSRKYFKALEIKAICEYQT